MSQFPVEDQTSVLEGVNYLLSGPAGLGQNFEGFSSYTPVYVKPTVRAPFTLPLDTAENPLWTIAPIAISNITVTGNVVNSNAIEVTYSSPQSPAPFTAGDIISISGVTPGWYNDTYTVLTGNTTTLLLGTNSFYDWTPYLPVTGYGEVYRDWTDALTSTDCNAFVNILGPTDQAFISAQIKLDYDWTANTAGSEFDLVVTIDRLRGSAVVDQNATAIEYANQYLFQTDATVSFQRVHKTVSAPGSDTAEFIFTTALDTPGFGYYWYLLDVEFVTRPDYSSKEVGGPPVLGYLRNNPLSSSRYTYSGSINPSQVPVVVDTYNTYANVTATPISGTGPSVAFDVYLYNRANMDIYNNLNCEVYVTDPPGSPFGYEPGDQLKILGTALGGSTPANDLILTVNQVLYGGNAFPGNVKASLRSLTAQVVKE